MGKGEKKLERTTTMPTPEAPATPIRKGSFANRSPSSATSPRAQLANFRKRIEAEKNVWWLARWFGQKPNLSAIGSLYADMAKTQSTKLLQLEDAADSYIEAAEYYRQANNPSEEASCRRQAVTQFTKQTNAPSAVEKDLAQRDRVLEKAIKQLNLIQAHLEEEAKWEPARRVAEEKAQFYIEMGMYKEAANEYKNAALELCQLRADRINRCLMFCAACQILMGANALAKENWDRANENLNASSTAASGKTWMKEACITYVLCTLFLTLSQEDKEPLGVALDQAKASNKDLTGLLEKIEVAADEKDDAKFQALRNEVSRPLDQLMCAKIATTISHT